MDWFLYDNGLRHEMVKNKSKYTRLLSQTLVEKRLNDISCIAENMKFPLGVFLQ